MSEMLKNTIGKKITLFIIYIIYYILDYITLFILLHFWNYDGGKITTSKNEAK